MLIIIIILFLNLTIILSHENYLCEIEFYENSATFFETRSTLKKKNIPLSSNNVDVVPVVIHVIYETSAQNISDDQIIALVNVLNEDFRNMNGTPAFSNHSDAADTKIEFRLADKDPNGNNTNGITRHYVQNPTSYSLNNNGDVKLQNTVYWNRFDYLNIWIVPVMNQGHLGWAYLPDLKNSWPPPPVVEGAVIHWTTAGDKATYLHSGYNQGNILSHEVGHYFNLYHTFKDKSCSASGDYVSDTPPTDVENFDCNPKVNCPPHDVMIENYMDYTPDQCQNIFTEDQADHMNYTIGVLYPGLITSNVISDRTNYYFRVFSDHTDEYDYNVTTKILIESNATYDDFTLESNADMEMTAKQEIIIRGNTHFKAGSEAHLKIDDNLPSLPKKSIRTDNKEVAHKRKDLISISPNPTNSSINIEYVVAESGLVSLELYDNFGSKMLTLIDNKQIDAGTYNTTQDLTNYASGQYLVVLKINGEVTTKQFIKL